jgi:hypothetical protein
LPSAGNAVAVNRRANPRLGRCAPRRPSLLAHASIRPASRHTRREVGRHASRLVQRLPRLSGQAELRLAPRPTRPRPATPEPVPKRSDHCSGAEARMVAASPGPGSDRSLEAMPYGAHRRAPLPRSEHGSGPGEVLNASPPRRADFVATPRSCFSRFSGRASVSFMHFMNQSRRLCLSLLALCTKHEMRNPKQARSTKSQ